MDAETSAAFPGAVADRLGVALSGHEVILRGRPGALDS
jgi:hypothetical protein